MNRIKNYVRRNQTPLTYYGTGFVFGMIYVKILHRKTHIEIDEANELLWDTFREHKGDFRLEKGFKYPQL